MDISPIYMNSNLPEIVSLDKYYNNKPQLPDELIQGILRCGHKMLIAGPSKAGKSFLLIELAICIANGLSWLGHACKQGRVLYVNLEIDSNSCINRFIDIANAMQRTFGTTIQTNNIDLWNLRGHAMPLDLLVPILVSRVKETYYDVIIVDPIYKVITGDENNASEMGRFCNLFDKICGETGAATIYCHHHSKGAQGSKRAADRASGSGVFSRDPDAQLDMIQLALPADALEAVDSPAMTGWRIEGTLREFAPLTPINIWYNWPLHYLDTSGHLNHAHAIGSTPDNLSKSPKRTDLDKQLKLMDDVILQLSKINYPVMLRDVATGMNVTDKTVRSYIQKSNNRYWCKNGLIGLCSR